MAMPAVVQHMGEEHFTDHFLELVIKQLTDGVDEVGVYKCIWVYRGVYGCIWVYMSVYGCIWVYIGVYRCI